MRSIKFRGYPAKHVEKYPASKEYLPMYYLEFPSRLNGVNWWDEFDGKPRNVKSIAHQEWLDDLVLMQFTGIKDKNGKEIYEGDIITHSADGMIGVITWSEGLYRYVIENLAQTEIIADLCDYDADPEILGNIYQNQELLNEK